jgi:hypothetical protein
MRVDDWPERLAQYLEQRTLAFAWGRQDCVSFAADWVVECVGFDPAARWRGWTTAREALRQMEAAGGLAYAWGQALRAIPPGFAGRGDVGLVRVGRGRLASVIVERDTVVGPGPDGLVRLPRGALERAFLVA